jgi:hypothetical protein
MILLISSRNAASKVIGIIGSRKRNEGKDLTCILMKFWEFYKEGDWICSGGCPEGGDKFAEQIADEYGIPKLIFPPSNHKPSPQRYYERNNEIAAYCDILIACAVLPFDIKASGGTNYTCRKFRDLNPKDWKEKLFIV